MTAGAPPPWAYLPTWVIHDHRLRAIHWRVLTALCARKNRKTKLLNPSIETIAADTGDSERNVRKALADLRGWSVVDWRNTQRSDGGKGSNRYEIMASAPTGQLSPGGRGKKAGGTGHPSPDPPGNCHPINRASQQRSFEHSGYATDRSARDAPPQSGDEIRRYAVRIATAEAQLKCLDGQWIQKRVPVLMTMMQADRAAFTGCVDEDLFVDES